MTENARKFMSKVAAKSYVWNAYKKPMATGKLKNDSVLQGWDTMLNGIRNMSQDQASALHAYGGTMNGVSMKGTGEVLYRGNNGNVVARKTNPNLKFQDGRLVDTRSGMGFWPGGEMLASTQKQMQMDRKAQQLAESKKSVINGSRADLAAGRSIIRTSKNGTKYLISMTPDGQYRAVPLTGANQGQVTYARRNASGGFDKTTAPSSAPAKASPAIAGAPWQQKAAEQIIKRACDIHNRRRAIRSAIKLAVDAR